MAKKSFGLLLALIMIFCFSGMVFAADMSISVFDKPADIAFEQDELILFKDDTMKLTPILASDLNAKDIQWSSSDTDVVTVDKNGNIFGVQCGKAQIIAKIGNDTAVCDVSVVALIFTYQNGGKWPGATYLKTLTMDGVNVVSIDRSEPMYPIVYLDGATTASDAKFNVYMDIVGDGTDLQADFYIDGELVLNQIGHGIHQKSIFHEHQVQLMNGSYVEEIYGYIAKVNGDGFWTVTYKTVQLVLDAQNADLEVGENKALKADVKGIKNAVVTWKSSNESVAVVDAYGNVTAVGTGKAIITATEVESGYQDTCVVTVGNGEFTDLHLDKTELTLDRNSSAVLAASFSGNVPAETDYVWTSSDETVATVENGKVTALSSGKAVITVTCGEYSAACVVTVVGDPISGVVTLDKTELTLGKDKSAELTAALLEDMALEPSFKWVSSDRNVARVVNGEVTGIGYGTATIYAKYGDYQASCEVTVAPVVYADDALSLILAEPEGDNTVLFIDDSDLLNPIVYLNYDIASVSDIPALTAKGNANVGDVAFSEGMASQTVTAGDLTVHITYRTSSLVLDQTELVLEEGKGVVLKAFNNGTDDATLTWESDNEEVAVVNNGIVIAGSPGEARIKVTAGNYSAVCKVTVIPVENNSGVYHLKTHVGNISAAPGDEIVVPVYVDDHDLPILGKTSHYFAYWDSTVLEYTGVSAGAGLRDAQVSIRDVYPFVLDDDSYTRIDFMKDTDYTLPEGELFYLHFKVRENAAAGVYPVEAKLGSFQDLLDEPGIWGEVAYGHIGYAYDNMSEVAVPGNVLISSGGEKAAAFANFDFDDVSVRSDENAVVHVDVTHDLNTTVKSLQIKPDYDTDAMTLTAASAGDALSGVDVSLADGIVTLSAENGFTLPQGEVLKLTFDMADTIADGSYAVGLDAKDQTNNRIVDSEDRSSYGVASFAGFIDVTNYYDVILKSNEYGTVLADKAEASVGEKVTLSDSPKTNYRLGSLTVTDAEGNPVSVTDHSFIMPASDVTVNAEFVEQKNMEVEFRMIGGTRPNYYISFGGVFNDVATPSDGYGKYNGAEYQNWVLPEKHSITEGTNTWQFVESMLKEHNFEYGRNWSLWVKSPKELSDVRGQWVLKNEPMTTMGDPELYLGFSAFWCITIERNGEYIELVDSTWTEDSLLYNTIELMPGDKVIFHFTYDANFELVSSAGYRTGYKDHIQNYLKIEPPFSPEEIAEIWIVEDLIDSIGMVTRESEEAILAARQAYSALEREQKWEVKNSSVLNDAINRYEELISNNMLNAPVLDGEAAEETTDKNEMTSVITLDAPAASADDPDAKVQYRISSDNGKNWGDWVESNVFENLVPGTAYCFQARYSPSEKYSGSAEGNTIKVVAPHVVYNRDEWLKAVRSAPTDGTRCIILIAGVVDVGVTGQFTTRLPLGSNVVMIGDGGCLKSSSGGQNNNGISVGLNSTLTLKDLTYDSIGPVGATQYSAENANFGSMIYFDGEKSTVNLDNVVMYGDCSETGEIFTCNSANCTLNIYSGTIENIATGSGDPRGGMKIIRMTDVASGAGLTVNIRPTADISMEGTFSASGNLLINLIPQDDYEIQSASTLYNGYRKFNDLADEVSAMNAASESEPYVFENGIGGLRVNVSEDGFAVPKKLESPDVDIDDIIIDYGNVTVPSGLVSEEQPEAVLQYRITKLDGLYWIPQSMTYKWRCEPMTFSSALAEDTQYRLEMRYNAIGGDYCNSDLTIVYFRTGYHSKPLSAPHLSNESTRTESSIVLTAPVASSEDTTATMRYRISEDQVNWSDWQDDLAFENLDFGTTYYFQAQYKANHYLWLDSDGSEIVEISTRARPLTSPTLSEEVVEDINTVTLRVPADSEEDANALVEYRISDDGENWYGEWQSSPVFEGLTGNTVYYFQARYVADNQRYMNSEASNVVRAITGMEATTAAIAVANVTSNVGNTVEVDITMVNNPGIVTAALQVDYDSSKLTLVGVENGNVLRNAAFSNHFTAPYHLYWGVSAEDISANGVLATLTFEVAEDAELGESPVTLSCERGSIYNSMLDNIDFNLVCGNVIIAESADNDINGDGAFDTKDATSLKRYLAGWDGYSAETLNLNVADVNNDGVVNTKDVTYLTRAIAGWVGYKL